MTICVCGPTLRSLVFVRIATALADSIRETDPDNADKVIGAIHEDLQSIAKADGKVASGEQAMLNNLKGLWEI